MSVYPCRSPCIPFAAYVLFLLRVIRSPLNSMISFSQRAITRSTVSAHARGTAHECRCLAVTMARSGAVFQGAVANAMQYLDPSDFAL